MFQILSLSIVAGVFALASRLGPRRALLVAWPPAMLLLPVWMIMEVGSLTLELRTVAETAILVSFLVFPGKKTTFPKINTCDALLLVLLAVQVLSQYNAGSVRPLTLPEIARKTLLPYLMGRLFLTGEDDLRDATRIFAPLLLLLTGLTVFECVLKINPINTALGMTFHLLEQGEGYRWGLKRAHVTFNHPIFYGMALVLMIPWAIEAARRSKAGEGSRWWRLLPALVGVALFCTVSRGPQLAGMFAAAVYFFFRVPKARIPMLATAAVLGLLAQANKELIVEILGKAAGEKQEELKFIEIDGEEYEYSGTNHRMLLFLVYDKAIQGAGMFGYGTELRGVEVEESLQQTFGSIDCHYLLFLLHHGWLGVTAFILLTLAVLLKLGRTALQIEKPGSAMAAGLAGAMAGVAFLLVSVWFSADFAGVWLFSAGLASGLQFPPSTCRETIRSGPPEPATKEIATRQRRCPTPDRPIPKRDTPCETTNPRESWSSAP